MTASQKAGALSFGLNLWKVLTRNLLEESKETLFPGLRRDWGQQINRSEEM
jgi:hypothetical protein